MMTATIILHNIYTTKDDVTSKREYVSIEDVTEAWRDFRKNKRRADTVIRYEMDCEENNLRLWRELNSMAYEIGTSIAFCVTYPKVREVFAANPRDRIVHHIIMRKFLPLFEARMIDSSYNCRKGKGVMYGIKDLQRKMQRVTRNGTREAWCLCLDVRGFFMSIDKGKMYAWIETILREDYGGDDIGWWLWLIRKIVMHRPEQNCEWHGNTEVRKRLPPEKSLFTSNGKGLPIGNYTSQIFANLFLTILDNYVLQMLSAEEDYVRFVDDFRIISNDRKRLLVMLNMIRRFLRERLGLSLHERKTAIVKVRQGVNFTGYVIRPDRIYVGKHTVKRTYDMIAEWNRRDADARERYVRRYNSYMGFLSKGASYNIRKQAWQMIADKDKLCCHNLRKIRIIKHHY